MFNIKKLIKNYIYKNKYKKYFIREVSSEELKDIWFVPADKVQITILPPPDKKIKWMDYKNYKWNDEKNEEI